MNQFNVSTNSSAFKNARKSWIDNIQLKGHASQWDARFELWLLAQGATLNKSLRPTLLTVTDVVGVCPGHDTLEFESDPQRILFLLRYS